MKQRGFTLIVYAIIVLAVLGTLAAIVAGIYGKGKDVGRAQVKGQWDRANAEARKREQEASAKAAKALEAERQKRKVVIRERTVYVDKIVDRPVYRNVCLDADGLRCLGSAIRGESAAGCKPDKPVPPAAPSGRG